MSLDNVTVNMSRLALARAIKTPDGDDTEADPWNKSVIFHQSHIPQAIEQHKGHRRGHGQHAARQSHSHRPQHDRMPQQRTPPPAQRPRSQAQVVASPQRQAQGSAPATTTKARVSKTYISSDDEDEEQEEEEEEEESSDNDEESYSHVQKVKQPNASPSLDAQEIKSKSKVTHKQPLPSDDESSDSDNEEGHEDEDASSVEITPQRHSDPRSSSNGSRVSFSGASKNGGGLATHHRSRSLSDMVETRLPGPRLHDVSVPSPPIEHWRRSADPYGRTADAYDSQHLAAVYMHGRSKSSERLDKVPMVKPSTPLPGRSGHRKSTMIDYDQQQKMQYHHSQQLGQIQQYQAGQNKNRKGHANRASMSGMDMLLQLEHEKQQLIKNKPKKLDSTNAPIDGLLGKLPESGTYNINFQHLQGSKSHGTRSSGVKAEGNTTRDSYKQPIGRPNSAMGYFDTRPSTANSASPDHRRSRLSPWMEAPYPTSSISTPASHLQRQYQQQLMMMDHQQQMMQNQYLIPAPMLHVPMNYGPMMPPMSPEAAMRQGIPRPTSSMSKRSSSAWGAT